MPPVGDYTRHYDPLSFRLMRHYKSRARGQSVLRIGGVYQTIETPSQTDIDSASEYYAGGHVYQVSDAVSAALVAAGYVTTPSVPGPGVESYEWRDLALSSWQDFSVQRVWA